MWFVDLTAVCTPRRLLVVRRWQQCAASRRGDLSNQPELYCVCMRRMTNALGLLVLASVYSSADCIKRNWIMYCVIILIAAESDALDDPSLPACLPACRARFNSAGLISLPWWIRFSGNQMLFTSISLVNTFTSYMVLFLIQIKRHSIDKCSKKRKNINLLII